MKNFEYIRADNAEQTISLLSEYPNARLLGGGTNLVDLMRENIEQPDVLIDVTSLPLDEITMKQDGGFLIGAEVRNTAIAAHEGIRKHYPFVAEAVLAGASGQIRNMATTAGNLMQRTRCLYFYDRAANCNKRKPGSGCDAIHGFNRMHAVLGASESCIATHPSDLCVALVAVDAQVRVIGSRGERQIPLVAFHRLPGDTPQKDTNLGSDELIVGIEIPRIDFATRSTYRKVRDRSSYAFALVSVAAALKVENGIIVEARIALGGVAHKPWRASLAEKALVGAGIGRDSFMQAAEAEFAAAKGFTHNAFKIELAKRTIVSVLGELTHRHNGHGQ